MKKFLINIAIFFAIVAVVDFSLGKVFHYLQWNIAGGRTGNEFYACKESNEDVIIMGSSRAAHHYDPQIISDTLGLSCFNAGEDGNGIIMQYGRWKMISERYTPKLIIYDIFSLYDVEHNDNMAYVDRLKPYCDNLSVKNYVSELFPLERIKLYSLLYCYNYKFLELLSDCLKARNKNDGFSPLNGQILQAVADRPIIRKDYFNTDFVKLAYLEKLVIEANIKGTKLVFAISPSWKGGHYELSTYSDVLRLANKYKIPIFSYIDSSICDEPNLFKDSSHLNKMGSSEYTKDLVSRLRKEGEYD